MVASIAGQLAEFRFAKLFQPFELVFRDGRRIEITDPEWVGWHAENDALSYAAEDDSFIHATLSEVSAIRPIPANGKGTAA